MPKYCIYTAVRFLRHRPSSR